MQVQSLGLEDPLEHETATHSSLLAWTTQWAEESGGLQSLGSQSQTRLSPHVCACWWYLWRTPAHRFHLGRKQLLKHEGGGSLTRGPQDPTEKLVWTCPIVPPQLRVVLITDHFSEGHLRGL